MGGNKELLKPDFNNRGKTPPIKTCVIEYYLRLYFVIDCPEYLFVPNEENGEYDVTEYGVELLNDLFDRYKEMRKFFPEGCHVGKSKFIFPKLQSSFNNVLRQNEDRVFSKEKIALMDYIINVKYRELYSATFVKSELDLREFILNIYSSIYEINDYYDTMEYALDNIIMMRKGK